MIIDETSEGDRLRWVQEVGVDGVRFEVDVPSDLFPIKHIEIGRVHAGSAEIIAALIVYRKQVGVHGDRMVNLAHASSWEFLKT